MKTFMVLPFFLILSLFNSINCKRYNKKENFVIVVDDEENGGNRFKNNYYPEYPKYQNYQFNKIPDPNKMLKFQPSDARYYFWKHKLTTTTTTEAPTTTEMPETTTEMMTTETPTTTEMPTETVPSVDYDLSNIPTNYPQLLMYYKLCPVNITGKYNPKDIPLPQTIPPAPTASSFNYFSQNYKPSEISSQFPIKLNADPFTNNYLSLYGSQLPVNSLTGQSNYFGDQTSYGSNQIYANQFSSAYKNPSTLSTASNGIKYGPLGEIAGYEQHNYGTGSSKYIPGYLQNNEQLTNQQASIYLPPTFSSSGTYNTKPSSESQTTMFNDMKDLYQNMGLQVVDLTMSNKNFQEPNGIRINKQLGIVANTKLSPKTAASKLVPISTSNNIPQAFNQFNPNTLKNYGFGNLNNNLLYFGPTDKSNKFLSPSGTKFDFTTQQRSTLI